MAIKSRQWKKTNKCHGCTLYNWLWNCKHLIAHTRTHFGVSLLGFLFLCCCYYPCWQTKTAIEYSSWNLIWSLGDGNSGTTTTKHPYKKWMNFVCFTPHMKNHSNWILPLFAHLTFGVLCFFLSLYLQLQWNVYPICRIPVSLRGKPISDLNGTALLDCLDIDSNDLYDIGGISENILLIRGNGF